MKTTFLRHAKNAEADRTKERKENETISWKESFHSNIIFSCAIILRLWLFFSHSVCMFHCHLKRKTFTGSGTCICSAVFSSFKKKNILLSSQLWFFSCVFFFSFFCFLLFCLFPCFYFPSWIVFVFHLLLRRFKVNDFRRFPRSAQFFGVCFFQKQKQK